MQPDSNAGNFQFIGTGPYSAGLVDGYGDHFDNPDNRLKIGGIENEIQFNGYRINVKGKQDSIKITSIDGLADADVRDTREVNPGYDGETAFESYYGGRTITLSGYIKTGSLNKLRDMQEGLKNIFAPLDESVLVLKGISPEYDVQILCRKTQPITMAETQQGFEFKRDFQVTLRASDFRFTSTTINESYWDFWQSLDDQYSNDENSYSSLVLDDSPTVYWRMNEASGATTFINSVASGTYAGTINGSPSAVNASGAVLDGKYWDFNGSSSYVSSSASVYASGASASFETWFYRDSTSSEDVIFGSDNATNSPRISLPSGTNTVLFKPNGASGTGVTFTSSNATASGIWKHLALTFSNTTNTANLYINGVSVASGTTSDDFNATPGNLQVGRSAKSDNGYFDGKLAEVAVYPKVLSSTKVLNHYRARTKYFSSVVDTNGEYAGQIYNIGNYLADAIIKIEGPIYATASGAVGIIIKNTTDENLNVGVNSTASEYLTQDIKVISSGGRTTALSVNHFNELIINAPSDSSTVLGQDEYFLINSSNRTITKYTTALPRSAYDQLDKDSEWIKFSPGVNPIYVNCPTSSKPLITIYHRDTFI